MPARRNGCELRSLLITANQPFGEWNKVLPDETTAVAAVDRLVHHGTILEMNVESYRRRSALDRSAKRPGPGRPARFRAQVQALLRRTLTAEAPAAGRPTRSRRASRAGPIRGSQLLEPNDTAPGKRVVEQRHGVREPMNKAEMVGRLAARTGLREAVARDAVDGVFAIIGEALADGEDVRVPGFGTFGTRSRPARTGRNPGIGEAVSISASKLLTFKAGKTLKDTVNAGPES